MRLAWIRLDPDAPACFRGGPEPAQVVFRARVRGKSELVTEGAAIGAAARRLRRMQLLAGVLLGVGFGGFVDGIVLHQLLQWHHLLTNTSFSDSNVSDLQDNTLADGLFHLSTWIASVAGVVVIWLLKGEGADWSLRSLVGLLALGWGGFNLVEGVVNHHLLDLHHVRDDTSRTLPWDLGFLALGALLLVVGWALRRSSAKS